MKKFLAFMLCFLIVSCSSVTVFASGTAIADGTVLYSATFDGSTNAPKNLEDAGLALCEAQSSFKAEIGKSGLLSVSQSDKYSNIGFKEDVVGNLDTYTMQVTFRWVDPFTNAAAGINPCVGGYDSVNNTRSAINATNVRFNSYRTDITATSASAKSGQPMVEYYGHLDKTVYDAWKPEANAYDSIPGNWVTVSVEVSEGALGKVTVAVVGLEPVIFEKPADVGADNLVIPDGNPYLRFGNAFKLEIYDIRLVAGINVQNMQTPTLPARPTLQTGSSAEVDTGNVLYYQRFNKAFGLTRLNATGLMAYSDMDARVTIDEDGYLKVDNATGAKNYKNTIKLPDVVPDGLASYTWEMKFRYISSQNHGCITPSWGENGTSTKLGLALRYNQNGKFDNVATSATDPVNSNAVASWLADDFGAGSWINMKIAVKDGFLYTITITVDDKYSGQQITWSTDSPEYSSLIPFDEEMIIRVGPETVAQFASIRVVEGVDYTEYKGDYATTSYSGHADSAAVEEKEDVQGPTVNEQKPPVQQQKPNNDTVAAPEAESETETTEEKKGCGGFATSSVAVMGVMTAICGAMLIKRKKKE